MEQFRTIILLAIFIFLAVINIRNVILHSDDRKEARRDRKEKKAEKKRKRKEQRARRRSLSADYHAPVEDEDTDEAEDA